MNLTRRRPFGQNYAFVVAAVVFLCLLASAGLRSAPSVMLIPLEQAFGWSRDLVSLSAAIGIFLYGLVGPFAAALMQRFGIRRVLVLALVLMSAATALSTLMREPWHLFLTWGVLSGLGSGCVAVVLGATVVSRWFASNRGLMMGILTASTATGTLLFLPVLAWLAQTGGWMPVAVAVALATGALVPVVWLLVPERPQDIGLVPYGARPSPHAAPAAPAPAQSLFAATLGVLGRAMKQRTFWYLFATFYICGFTTNGLVGTHLIALCADRGIVEVQAAGLMAMMGLFDLVGTTLSGWLTDRFDARKLLFLYYSLRGLSLMLLPFSDFSLVSLSVFAVFYGLDWIATVPPTLRLTTEAFGERDAPVVFGWIVAGHQVGAASAAWFGGAVRTWQGDYLMAFVIAGATGLVAAILALLIRSRPVAPFAAAR
ncbi:MFS transporter [Pseudoxanthobacter sp.]|uniref:MFS transporter n=1 Tax=Pseudoxanthobacter sp. TaxID=1925742 RepID=UPI002FDF33BF